MKFNISVFYIIDILPKKQNEYILKYFLEIYNLLLFLLL